MIAASLKPFIKHRRFVWEMAIHELRVRTKGSVLGLLWFVLVPLIQALTYVVVLAYVFQIRFRADGTPFDYVVYVLTGQMVWFYMVRVLTEAPLLLRSKAELVKQVRYPVATLPATTVMIGGIAGGVILTIAIILSLIAGKLAWSIFLLPVPILMFVAFLLGACWLLMVVGVFFKDMSELISVTFGALIFLSPVLLSEQIVGPTLWTVILFNPASHFVIAFRDVVFGDFSPVSWIVFGTLSVVFFVAGWTVITRMRLKVNEYL